MGRTTVLFSICPVIVYKFLTRRLKGVYKTRIGANIFQAIELIELNMLSHY